MAKYENRRVFNFLGFIATVLIASAILIAGIVTWIQNGHFGMSLPGLTFRNGVPQALICVANILAYIMAMIGGFAYAKSKRNITFLIVQIVCVVIILFVLITSFFF